MWKQTEHEQCTNLLWRAAADSPLQEWLVNLLQPVVPQQGQCSSPAPREEALDSSHLHLLPLEATTETMQNGSQQKKRTPTTNQQTRPNNITHVRINCLHFALDFAVSFN